MKTAWCAIVAAGILAAPGVQAVPPTVGECMALTPGIKFSKNNGDVQANVEATFAGRRLHGTQLLIDDFSMTFLGWERLELGGRRFPDACKFELHDVGGKSKGRSGDHVWYAQGFGLIMTDKLDVDGKVLPAQRIALQKIISAP